MDSRPFFILSVLVTFNVFAKSEVCSFETTNDFDAAVKHQAYDLIKTSKNHKKFSAFEKDLIVKTIPDYHYEAKPNIKEALHIFGDYYGDNKETGSNSGSIQYYKMNGATVILVDWYPRDNEVGSFFEMRNGKAVKVADISDGDIDCL